MTEARSDAIMARFLALHPKLIDLSLDRMWQILEKLGNPQKKLPPVIHVAGTNGKGSTIAFMRAMLEAAGKRVHVFTSPHLVRFHERIRLGAPGGGKLVSEAALVDAFTRVEAANGATPITVFEITTAAALLLFSEHPADVLLLEVGLGGRFDATNIVEKPVASVIASVSLDHMEYLGDTVAKIAFEKAGILRKGVPGIIAMQSQEARDTLEAEADKVGAPLVIAGQDFSVHEEASRLIYQDESGLLDLPLPRLLGRHQHDNAGTAIATLRTVFGAGFPAQAIERGLTQAEWPGRMQGLTRGPLVEMAPKGAEIWLDGGHNQDGGRVLASALAEFEERAPRPLILITAMLATKDPGAFFRSFKGLASEVIAVTVAGNEAIRSAENVESAAADAGLAATSCASVEQALALLARREWPKAPRIAICGSLYFIGEVLRLNGSDPV